MTAVRSLLRRAVRPLPAGTQNAIRELRNRATGAYDSVPCVRELREREQAMLDELITTARTNQAKSLRILVAVAQQSPPWLETSYALATALRLRGHDVRGVLCDGGDVLPLCEMNLGGEERPSCSACVGWLGRYEGAYGFRFGRLSEVARSGDREWAEAMIEAAGNQSVPLVVDGLDLRRLAFRELQRYRRGFSFEPQADPAYRDWLVVAAVARRVGERLVERVAPDLMIASSGRTLLSACLVAAARARGVRVVTWDTEPSFPDGLVFSHDAPAVEVPLDDAWQRVRLEPLTDDQRGDLKAFLSRWSRSDGTPFPYNTTPVSDRAAIRSALGLREGVRLIAAFSNSAWDMGVVDRDVGFAHMFEWLFALVDWADVHPEIALVVRAHPAEANVPPDLQSRTPVADEIRRRYPSLPPNVALVDGHSAIDSYELAAMADVAMVYSSRFGLELAVNGRRPWLIGDVTYRGKGFTRDIASKTELLAALDAGDCSDALSDAECAFAERFAYLWFFRYVTRAPLLRPSDGRFALSSFRQLAAGGDRAVDRLCDGIVHLTPFQDLAR